MTLEYHPLANLFPLIEGEDFDRFVEGFRADGTLHDKIVLLDGQILDGRNRYRACRATGITPHFEQYNANIHGDPLTYVISKNLHRRHLNESQRAMVAANLATMRQGERTDLEPSANLPKVDQATAADKLNVSERSLRSAKKVREEAEPELVQAVEQGIVPVSLAEKAIDLPAEKQREIVDRVKRGDPSGAKGEIKKHAREARERDLGEKQRALPAKRYGVILADPEWRFEVYSRETGMDRAADNHYPTSDLELIKSRPVGEIAADDCVLFLWATVPMLPQALTVLAAWGFEYRSHVAWLKDRIGTGYWFRNQHELLLVGVRGNIPAPAAGTQFNSALAFAAGAHSEKPPFAYEIAEVYFPNLPKIELNARRARPGWDAWGLEAPQESRSESNEGQSREPGTMTVADGVASRPSEPGGWPHANVSKGVTPAASEQAATRSPSDETPDLQVARDVREEAAPIPNAGASGGGAASPSPSESGFLSPDMDIPTDLRRTRAVACGAR